MAGVSLCDSKSFFRSATKCLGESRLGLGVRPQRQPMPHQVLLGCGERVEVLRWRWVEAHPFPVGGLLSSHDTLLSIARSWERQLAQDRVRRSNSRLSGSHNIL